MVCILPFLQNSVTSRDGFVMLGIKTPLLPCHPLGGGAQRRMTFQTNQLLLSRILISGLVYKHECDLSKRNDGTDRAICKYQQSLHTHCIRWKRVL